MDCSWNLCWHTSTETLTNMLINVWKWIKWTSISLRCIVFPQWVDTCLFLRYFLKCCGYISNLRCCQINQDWNLDPALTDFLSLTDLAEQAKNTTSSYKVFTHTEQHWHLFVICQVTRWVYIQYSLSFQLYFGVHQPLREIPASLAANHPLCSPASDQVCLSAVSCCVITKTFSGNMPIFWGQRISE